MCAGSRRGVIIPKDLAKVLLLDKILFMTLLGRRRALAPEWPKSGLARGLSRQRNGRMTLHCVMSMLVAGIYNVR